MNQRLPTDSERLRCSHCGNLTRFDVERQRHTKEYWHSSLAGQHRVESETVLSEAVVRISCRWCGAAEGIEIVDRPDPEDAPVPEPGLGGTP